MMVSSRTTVYPGKSGVSSVQVPRPAHVQAGTSPPCRPREAGSSTFRRLMFVGSWIVTLLGAAALLLAFVWDALAIDPSLDRAHVRSVVSQYYAQINEAIRTGDLSLLDSVAALDRGGLNGVVGPACELRCRVR